MKPFHHLRDRVYARCLLHPSGHAETGRGTATETAIGAAEAMTTTNIGRIQSLLVGGIIATIAASVGAAGAGGGTAGNEATGGGTAGTKANGASATGAVASRDGVRGTKTLTKTRAHMGGDMALRTHLPARVLGPKHRFYMGVTVGLGPLCVVM